MSRVRTPTYVSTQVPETLAGHALISPICQLMLAGRCVSFTYDGKPRVVEVHAIGTSTKDGGLVMRGVQVAGGASRPLPQWTLFRLDQIRDLGNPLRESFAPRDGYRMGDSQMRFVIAELEV
jgi:hypothetical protein